MTTAFLIMCFFILMQGFFAGMETGMVSVLRPRAEHVFKTNPSCRARLILFFLDNPNTMISTTLIGVNISVVGASLSAKRFMETLGYTGKSGMLISTFVLALLLLSCEIIPKNWFRQSPYKRCAQFIPLLYFSYFVLILPVFLFSHFTEWLNRVIAPKKKDTDDNILRENFRLFIWESEGFGSLDPQTARLLRNASDLPGLTLQQIMTGRENVPEIPVTMTVREAFLFAQRHNTDRLPVYNPQDTSSPSPRVWCGIFNVYDAIYALDETKWEETSVSSCFNELHILKTSDSVMTAIEAGAKHPVLLFVIEDSDGRQVGAVSPQAIATVLFEQTA